MRFKRTVPAKIIRKVYGEPKSTVTTVSFETIEEYEKHDKLEDCAPIWVRELGEDGRKYWGLWQYYRIKPLLEAEGYQAYVAEKGRGHPNI